MSSNLKKNALVLSGGGARGAYEAGVIHYLRTNLPKSISGNEVFNIQCGSSVGAINTCFMASYSHDLKAQGKLIYKLWQEIDQEKVYKRNITALAKSFGRSVKGISHNLLILNPFNPYKKNNNMSHFGGVLDTSPLPEYLKSIIPFKQIHKNIQNRKIDAVSLTATNTSTGKMELFIHSHPSIKYTGDYPHHFVKLNVEHAIASGAIPVIFPAVEINNQYYVDGGLRLNTPFSPAIQLGADKLMVIGLHYRGNRFGGNKEPISKGYPSLGQLVGLVMNALFLDRIQYDLEQLERINRIVDWGNQVYQSDFIFDVNQMIKKEKITGDIANRGLKKLEVFHIEPSQDISEVFLDCFKSTHAEKGLNFFEKLLFRLLDIDPVAGSEILSYLSFTPSYIKRLLELGYEDAKAYHHKLIDFFEK